MTSKYLFFIREKDKSVDQATRTRKHHNPAKKKGIRYSRKSVQGYYFRHFTTKNIVMSTPVDAIMNYKLLEPLKQ